MLEIYALFYFQLFSNSEKDLQKFEKDTGMKIFHPSEVDSNIPFPSRLLVSGSNHLYEIPALPNLNSTRKRGKSFSLNSDSLVSEYNTSAQCAIATTVFGWIDIPQSAKIAIPLKPNMNYLNATDSELISAVIDAIRHPPCIVKVAEDYIRDILKSRKYIGLHWRYDQRDWMHIACRNDTWKKTCEKISQTTPSHLAEVIASAIKEERNISKEQTPIYIATPPSLANFVDKVYGNISRNNKNFMKPKESVAMYLVKRHHKCWNANGWSIPEQIISLCEMEVMARSEWFFYSVKSSWSSNIRPFRFTVNEGKVMKRYEKDILQLI